MKFSILGVVLVALAPLCASALDTQAPAVGTTPSEAWWTKPYPGPFDAKQLTHQQSHVRVQGNQFVDEAGSVVIFHGVNLGDPDKLARQGKWTKAHFQAAKSFGANVLRLPIHPIGWHARGQDDYFKLLDQAVVWANELGMYLIIDWHSMGNVIDELYAHPRYQTSQAETIQFWQGIALRYAGLPSVALYDIYNEPTAADGKFGTLNWAQWKAFNEKIIAVIRAYDKNVIALVSGLNWAYDLSGVLPHPIEAQNVAYAVHVWPSKGKGSQPQGWEADWGYVADKYPLVVTSVGWMPATEPGAHVPLIGDKNFGVAISDYLLKKGISYTVCWFDVDFAPRMIADWNYTPSEQGAFFKAVMLKAEQATVGAKKHQKPTK